MYKEALINLPLVKEPTATKVITPDQAAKYCEDMRDKAQEMFVVLTLNVKSNVIDRHLVSLGTANSSLVHPREVFRPAITDGASSIIILHNHPSGDCSPSAQDITITRKLVEAGKILSISIMDHVIVGKETEEHSGFLSLRESGLVEFS